MAVVLLGRHLRTTRTHGAKVPTGAAAWGLKAKETEERMSRSSQQRFLFVLALIAIALVAFVISPFASALFGACVLAGALFPMQERLARRLHDRRYLAAGILTFGIVLCVLTPLAVTTIFVVREARSATHWLNQTIRTKGIDGVVEPLPSVLRSSAKRGLAMLPAGVLESSHAPDEVSPQQQASSDGKAGPSISSAEAQPSGTGGASSVLAATSRVGSLLAQLGVCVLAIFFLLADGSDLVEYIIGLLPLEPARSREMLQSFRELSVGILLSAFATAAAQTTVASVGYLIAGVPSLPLVVLLTAVCSFFPAVGGSAVTIAAGAWVWMSGRPGMGIFLIIWGIVAVGLIDNLVKPWVTKSHAQLPGSVVFFAMILGLAAFGPLGLVAGPLVAVFFQIVARMLREERAHPVRTRRSERASTVA